MITRNMRTERADAFWHIAGLPKWEQVAFAVVNFPFSIVGTILSFLLFIPFQIMMFLSWPFHIVLHVGGAIWIVCLGILLGVSFVTEKMPILRPITFLLALPVMVIAHNVNGIVPAPTPEDMEAKALKWDMVESFPYTWSLLRFYFSGKLPPA
jgi:hypothetical protein